MDYQAFDAIISEKALRSLERAMAILWLGKVAHNIDGMTAKEIAGIIENDCGHPRQNANRLDGQLRTDRRTAKYQNSGFRLRPEALRTLGKQYGELLGQPSAPRVSKSPGIVPRVIFEPSRRGYLIRLVDQLNGCYQNGYFDAVMILERKLLETLIIEVYVQANRASEIKQSNDGSFLGFEDLSGKIAADLRINITRETKRALANVKKFGDQSAHNQRFTAQLSDVEDAKYGVRIAAEELLHHCNYIPA